MQTLRSLQLLSKEKILGVFGNTTIQLKAWSGFIVATKWNWEINSVLPKNDSDDDVEFRTDGLHDHDARLREIEAKDRLRREVKKLLKLHQKPNKIMQSLYQTSKARRPRANPSSTTLLREEWDEMYWIFYIQNIQTFCDFHTYIHTYIHTYFWCLYIKMEHIVLPTKTQHRSWLWGLSINQLH